VARINFLRLAVVVGVCVACTPAVVIERVATPEMEDTPTIPTIQATDVTVPEVASTPTLTPASISTTTPAATVDVSQGEILFSVYPDGDIGLVDADGSNEKILLDAPMDLGFNTNRHASWLPDGSGISYTVDDFTQAEIWVMDSDGGNQHFLIGGAASNSSHCWSPDGSMLAYVSTRFRINLYNMTNNEQISLTDGSLSLEGDPDWSLDGSQIAFSATAGGNQDIYIINADGTGLVRVTNHPASDKYPDWSPDGTMIVFSSPRDGDTIDDIFVIDITQGMEEDGNIPLQLTFGETFDVDPDWNWDGSIIVYAAHHAGASHATLFLINATGGSSYQLLRENTYHFPQWRPR
jgi:Tol biopolymer transport system component